MKKTQRKLFIVFDGPEGGGKSTQAKLLCEHLKQKGYDVVLTREPGGTKMAEMVRKIILSPRLQITPMAELLLYEAARAQHIAEVIAPSLKENKIVISDRFADASVVYQGYARGLGMKFVETLNRLVVGGITPDITFILDIHPDEGLSRIKNRTKNFDRMEKEDLEFHHKIREGYLKLANRRKNFYIIDVNNKSSQEVHDIIVNILKRKFKL
ncbi:MAG: dTMP kinase [Elusimicrobiota bacterium]|nr:dTMP kinase [Endomicrobiia bacterium]MDW8055821.1 dTMP kinase [Elusimicrobiota bacterium]